MSEALTTDLWEQETEEGKNHWREIVAKRASITMGRDGGAPQKAMSMEARFPEASAKALFLLSETDLSTRRIAKQCGFMQIQVDRLAVANAPTLEHQRPALAKKFTQIAEKTAVAMGRKLEMMLEDSDEGRELLAATPINHLAIALGVSVDKAGGLSNISTSQSEIKVGLSLDDAAKMIEAAKAKVAARLKGEALEAEVIE